MSRACLPAKTLVISVACSHSESTPAPRDLVILAGEQDRIIKIMIKHRSRIGWRNIDDIGAAALYRSSLTLYRLY